MRHKLTIEYNGTGFSGWQKQQHSKSVQGVLEDALHVLFKHEVPLYGSGRTDAGVHALGQTAHFDIEYSRYDVMKIVSALNAITRPHLVSVLSVESVSEDFHARFSAKKRHYQYTIINRRAPVVLGCDCIWQVHSKLNVDAMRDAAACLVGMHDFSAFRAAECQAASPIRTIDVIDLQQEAEKIKINFSAQSFLHKQVRIIVGTLQKVGLGILTPDDIGRILASRNRTKAGTTAPAAGLCFIGVDY